ncbi:hypothetical protein [Streptomyces sp. MJM1172]|uniref:hypothetical protein n=1 Tax=Streptomyces sp. MJM1172 TaxID=1703926 RepID=UPI00093AF169|nr:hypothetical protein [Streptomyces sp. MJM1172]OKI71404.1 hypothetical protein AMK15_01895 [Streptomyces sp. MJM1172]
MAFYLVTDGRKNEYGEADTFVVRAGGRRQAVALAPVINRKDAEAVKLEDGRDVANGVILSALADFTEGESEAESITLANEETVEVTSEVTHYAVI